MTLPAGAIVGVRRSSGVSHWGVLGGAGMLLNISQCTGWPPQQIIIWSHMSIVLRVINPVLEVLKKYCVLVFKNST